MNRLRRLWFLGVIGVGGVLVLLSLGLWQLGRLSEKQAQIEELAAQLNADPARIAGDERFETHNFKPAFASGRFDARSDTVRYLVTIRPYGPGFRLIDAFEMDDGRRILVDRGYAPETAAPRGGEAPTPPSGPQNLVGALHWPRESSSWTPEPNMSDRIWFSREVDSLAAALDTDPILLVLSQPPAGQNAEWPSPQPVTIDLPNNHLSYALTWLALAAVWSIMSLLMARELFKSDSDTVE